MISISVDAKNVTNGLGKLIKNLEFSKPLKEAKKALDIETRRNFDLQGYIYGNWKPLKQETREQRARLGYGGARPILVRTGKLRGSFKGEVKQDTLNYRNTDKIAPYHQFGTRKMPQRKILDISDKFKGALARLIANHIAQIITKHYG